MQNTLQNKSAMNANITTATTTLGAAIDLAEAERASFVVNVHTFTNGSFTLLVEESDDVGFSTPNDVPASRVLGNNYDVVLTGPTVLAANQVHSYQIVKEKRFARFKAISTGTTACRLSVLSVLDRLKASLKTDKNPS